MPAANPWMETKRSSVQPVPLGGNHSQRPPTASHPNRDQFCCELLWNSQDQVLKDREEAGFG